MRARVRMSLCYRFEDWAFSFSPLTPLYTRLYKPSDLALARNCCLARILPGEAELVSEWTGLPGEAKSVKRFERSNGLDTALYKNYLYLFFHSVKEEDWGQGGWMVSTETLKWWNLKEGWRMTEDDDNEPSMTIAATPDDKTIQRKTRLKYPASYLACGIDQLQLVFLSSQFYTLCECCKRQTQQ